MATKKEKMSYVVNVTCTVTMQVEVLAEDWQEAAKLAQAEAESDIDISTSYSTVIDWNQITREMVD